MVLYYSLSRGRFGGPFGMEEMTQRHPRLEQPGFNLNPRPRLAESLELLAHHLQPRILPPDGWFADFSLGAS